VHDLEIEGTRVRCEVDTARLGEVLHLLVRADMRSLVSQPPTLEELFLRHYEDERPALDGAAPASGEQAEVTR
jgi:ABC-2 type transport system ATP-binding protein